MGQQVAQLHDSYMMMMMMMYATYAAGIAFYKNQELIA